MTTLVIRGELQTGVVSRGRSRLLRIWCALSGHADALVLATKRMALGCVRCGRTTPGWSVGR